MLVLFTGWKRLEDFTVEVSNDSDIAYTQCAYRQNQIPQGGSETLQCDSPLIARYVRIRHLSLHLFTVCEVIVTGHRYIGKASLCLSLVLLV